MNKKAVCQFEAIRRSGLVNMMNKNVVQILASKNDFHELVVACEDDYLDLFNLYSKLIIDIKEEEIPEMITKNYRFNMEVEE